jgi:hypothetical protein
MADDDEMPVLDPEGPPVMSERTQKIVQQVGKACLMVIGGTAAFLLLAVVATPTSGALRSQHAKWQERQRETGEEVARQKATDAAPLPANGPEEGHHE